MATYGLVVIEVPLPVGAPRPVACIDISHSVSEPPAVQEIVAPLAVTADEAKAVGMAQAGGVQLEVNVPKEVGRGVVAAERAYT